MDRANFLQICTNALSAASDRDALRALLSLEAKAKTPDDLAVALGLPPFDGDALVLKLAAVRLATNEYTGSPDVYRLSEVGRDLVQALAKLGKPEKPATKQITVKAWGVMPGFVTAEVPADLREQRAGLSERGQG